MITWKSLISGSGVLYNFYYDICCNGVLTEGMDFFSNKCCGTVAYDKSGAMCCDGAVVQGISIQGGDSCPGMYVSH